MVINDHRAVKKQSPKFFLALLLSSTMLFFTSENASLFGGSSKRDFNRSLPENTAGKFGAEKAPGKKIA
jgi:hypothetical protein